MPEVLKKYVETKDITGLGDVFDGLLKSYLTYDEKYVNIIDNELFKPITFYSRSIMVEQDKNLYDILLDENVSYNDNITIIDVEL
jgi:hypothetical protein